MAKTTKQKIGKWGEEQAADFLARQGYAIADRNYTIVNQGKKAAEVDIIAWHEEHYYGKTLCFVEVKTRTSEGDGSAERATNKKKKLAGMLKAARRYCLEKSIDLDRTPIQFEHVSVYVGEGKRVMLRKYVIPIE